MAHLARGRARPALLRLAGLIREHAEELSQLESRNIGKPISGARWEIGAAAGVFEYYGGAANKHHGETIPVAKPGLDLTLREPIGVVGLIVPWNFPLMMASLEAGARRWPRATRRSSSPRRGRRSRRSASGELALGGRASRMASLNVVTGPGAVTGAALAAHPGVGKIAFTGETGTGQEILRPAAGHHQEGQPGAGRQEPQRRVRGRRPRPVRARVALCACSTTPARTAAPGAGSWSSDRSTSGWSELFTAATQTVVVGDPADPATEMGPLVSAAATWMRVLDYIDVGQAEGRPAGDRWRAA